MKGNESWLELKVEGKKQGKRAVFLFELILTGSVYYIRLLV